MEFLQIELLKHIVNLICDESISCYLAGGYVRDWLLGQLGKDVDLSVSGSAIPLARRIANQTGGAFYVLDEANDTARIVYTTDDVVVDLAALRGMSIEADLRERDFTINAMAVNVREARLLQPSLIDPCGGQADLEKRVLRATSEHAFRSDPVRLLRGVRFAATLGLSVDAPTEAWMRRDAPLIAQPSAERVRQELMLILDVPDAVRHVRCMNEWGLLERVLPDLTALKGLQQSPPHISDVYVHTLDVLSEIERLTDFPDPHFSPLEAECLRPYITELTLHFRASVCDKRTRRTLLKLSALLHDVGKPAKRSVEPSGRIRFFGHEQVSAMIAGDVLTRLRFSTQEIDLVCATVAGHMRPGFMVKDGPPTRRAMYRFFRDTGGAVVDVLLLSLADHLATRGSNLQDEHWRTHLGWVSTLLDHYYNRPQELVAPPQLIDGRDVMQTLGLPPGPRIGELLEAVREAQAEGRVCNRQEALQFLHRCQ